MTRAAFCALVMDRLHALSDLQCRPMFGCFGLYGEGTFFAIICQERLFFRTDESTRSEYVDAGMEPFVFRDHQSTNSYYEVPPAVLRSPAKLTKWARQAIECQRARGAGKRNKGGGERGEGKKPRPKEPDWFA